MKIHCFPSHGEDKWSLLHALPTGITEKFSLTVICIYRFRTLEAPLKDVYRLFLSPCGLENSAQWG